MALVPPRTEFEISQINMGTGLWTVIVQVVESHRVQYSSGKKGGHTKPYKRLLLVDEHGTKVSGVLYENDIRYFSASLKPFNRYKIKNAKLTPAFGFFKVGDYNFTWVISNETPVELIDEPQVPPLPFSYLLCPFNELVQHADKEGGFHVKGVAIHAFPQRQVTGESTIREIVIINESKQPVILGLWNSFGEIEGKRISDNIANTPLIIGVNMRATTNCTVHKSVLLHLIEPPLHDNPSMKDWYALNKVEITQLLTDKAYKNTNLLLPPPNLNDTIDVPTAVATLNMAYHVAACPNCHKKVFAAAGWSLRCNSCDEYAKIELRCRVPIEITGGGQSLPVVMTTPDVEQLTGLTAEMLRDSHEFDFGVQDELQAALNKLDVVCFIKKYDPSTLGAPSSAGIRYTVVKAYSYDVFKKDPAPSASSSAPLQITQPADEFKISKTNAKKEFTDVERLPIHDETEASTPKSERSQHLITSPSTATAFGNTTLPCKQPDQCSINLHEPPSPKQSPSKKLKHNRGTK